MRELVPHAASVAAAYPSDATSLIYLARARAWQRNVAGAKQAYSKVLERYPQNEEARAYLKSSS